MLLVTATYSMRTQVRLRSPFSLGARRGDAVDRAVIQARHVLAKLRACVASLDLHIEHRAVLRGGGQAALGQAPVEHAHLSVNQLSVGTQSRAPTFTSTCRQLAVPTA